MTRLKTFIFLGFAIMFAAGLAIGWSLQNPAVAGLGGSTTRPSTEPAQRFPSLSQELDLTPEQHAQMTQIWDAARASIDKPRREIGLVQDERKTEIHTLLQTANLAAQYDDLQKKYDDRVSALRKEIDDTMHDAQARTRKLLTPQQLEKFDRVMREHGPHHGPPPTMGMGDGGPRRHHHPETSPTTRFDGDHRDDGGFPPPPPPPSTEPHVRAPGRTPDAEPPPPPSTEPDHH